MADAPGTVGRYRIFQRLGRGRLGDLYLAHDPLLERSIAIRLLPPLADHVRERVSGLLRSTARLSHVGIATVYDLGEHEIQLYVASEYIDGQALSQTIAAKTPVPRMRRLEWMIELCEALVFAEKHGIANLSIEAADVIVDGDGRPKIVDLGLAPLLDAVWANDGRLNPNLETLVGDAPDRRRDFFAAGVLLYELFTYEKPFGERSVEKITAKIANGAQWNHHGRLDPALEAIVARALQVDPAASYQSFEELLSDLRRIRAQNRDDEATVRSSTPTAPSAPADSRDRELLQLRQMRDRRVDEALIVANAALGARVYETAVEHAERALLLDPTNALAHEIIDRARAALEARRVAELVEAARQELAAGSLEAATAVIDQALALDPGDPSAVKVREAVENARRESELARERNVFEQAARREQEARARREHSPSPFAVTLPPVDPPTAHRVDDNVRFTVYRPPVMAPQRWYPLLLFAHLGERRPDAPPDEPDPLVLVETTAHGLLGPAAEKFPRILQDAGVGIPPDALLRIVPSVPDVTFNPPEYSFLWTESVHMADFKIRAAAGLDGRTARGAIDVRLGADRRRFHRRVNPRRRPRTSLRS